MLAICYTLVYDVFVGMVSAFMKGEITMNTLKLRNQSGVVLTTRYYESQRDLERHAFNQLGRTFNGETIASIRIEWADGTLEEYEY